MTGPQPDDTGHRETASGIGAPNVEPAGVRVDATQQRTEYVVFIPEDGYPNGRREVRRYAAEEAGEDPGEKQAVEHVAYLHCLPGPSRTRRSEAFAVEQTITIAERRL